MPQSAALCVLSPPELARLNDQEYTQWYIQEYGLSAMTKLKVDEDIRPLSDFRAGIASFVKQINETHRPMVLTQRGRGVAVLVGVHEYQKMQQRLELLEDICRAEAKIEAGEGVPHTEAKDRILRQLRQ